MYVHAWHDLQNILKSITLFKARPRFESRPAHQNIEQQQHLSTGLLSRTDERSFFASQLSLMMQMKSAVQVARLAAGSLIVPAIEDSSTGDVLPLMVRRSAVIVIGSGHAISSSGSLLQGRV